jgi:hypothetical protein
MFSFCIQSGLQYFAHLRTFCRPIYQISKRGLTIIKIPEVANEKFFCIKGREEEAKSLIWDNRRRYTDFSVEEKRIVDAYQHMCLEKHGIILPNTKEATQFAGDDEEVRVILNAQMRRQTAYVTYLGHKNLFSIQKRAT